jgi:hypothetical protein
MTVNDRPIFVVGAPRSGTTMLQLMLHAHPRIAIPPETRFLLPAYERRRDFGNLDKPANRVHLASWIVDRKGTAFRDLGLDKDEVRAEIVAGPPTLGSAIGIVFRAYARRFGKPRWGDKRPAYLQNLDVVRRLFPDAQIVHIVRDGRDCVASMRETPWHKGGVYEAIAVWAHGMDAGRRAQRMLGSDSYYEISYERLVLDPADELKALCGFLDEEYDPAMAAPNEIAAVAVPKRKKWHALTHSEVTPERIGSWARRLDPWEIGLCEAVMGDRLRERGYELIGGHNAGFTRHLGYMRHGTRAQLSLARQALTDGYYRMRPQSGVAALLTTAQLGDKTTARAADAP